MTKCSYVPLSQIILIHRDLSNAAIIKRNLVEKHHTDSGTPQMFEADTTSFKEMQHWTNLTSKKKFAAEDIGAKKLNIRSTNRIKLAFNAGRWMR